MTAPLLNLELPQRIELAETLAAVGVRRSCDGCGRKVRSAAGGASSQQQN
jgi:hypothetical protein